MEAEPGHFFPQTGLNSVSARRMGVHSTMEVLPNLNQTLYLSQHVPGSLLFSG